MRRLTPVAWVLVIACLLALICVIFIRDSSQRASAQQKIASSEVLSTLVSSRVEDDAQRDRSVLPRPANPLSGLLPNPLASPAAKLRSLTDIGDPFEAQLRAVRSGDPLLVVAAPYLTIHCADLAVQLYGKDVRAWMTEHSYDPKTGVKVAPDEALVRFNEAMQRAGPSRIYQPPEIRDEVVAMRRASSVGNKPAYTRIAALALRGGAPLTAAQRAAYSALVELSSAECRGRLFAKEFGAEYRAALDRLVGNGVVSAQLFNRRAGWQSDSTISLNDRDYDLAQRALAEWQADGIAQLLGARGGVTGPTETTGLPDDADGAAMMLQFQLGTLAACALGFADCSADSGRFRSSCMSFGGCEEPDLAAQLRHVFRRDGLDAAVIDREVNRVVTAYRNRDLEALGIRRANAKK